jgi:hypothetical protein
VQLQRPPQPLLRFLRAPGANQQVQRLGGVLQKIRSDVCADVSGGTGQESSHSCEGYLEFAR